MFVDFGILMYYAELVRIERETERRMMEQLSPEAFKEWKAEKTAERRHKELCSSIERAGHNARPYNFWGSR